MMASAAGLAAVAAPATARSAPVVPDGFITKVVATGLKRATAMAFAPDGRLFVCLQDGEVRVIENGRLLATPFVKVAVEAVTERGLLGIAVDPGFATNRWIYVYYTVPGIARNRISRFTADGSVARPGSERVLTTLDKMSNRTNHNGGALHFGPDGKLYVAVGDNSDTGDPGDPTTAASQRMDTRLGKILRLNRNGTIPADNPFYDTASGANRSIWALGLRNPFTFAFDPSGGRMFVNDVGQNTFEEVNEGVAGANYGWPIHEGPEAIVDPYTGPIHAYRHTGDPGGCAVVGAAFHDPSLRSWPDDYAGDYFYADLCGGWIRRFDQAAATDQVFATGLDFPVDLTIGPEGDLYAVTRGSEAAPGQVLRFTTDALFADGFESGDLSAWSAFTEDVDLAVSGSAALDATAFGLQATVGAGDRTPLYVQDDTPNDEDVYRALFRLQTNGFDPGGGTVLFRAFGKRTRWWLAVVLRRTSTGYTLALRARLDDGSVVEGPRRKLAEGERTIEIFWRRASEPGAADGRAMLWIDGQLSGRLRDLANAAGAVNRVRLGAVQVPAGASGTLYFDEVQSRRRTRPAP